MRLKLKLVHKGIILIAVPLAFEFIFVFVLTNLLNQAQESAKQQARSKEVVAATTKLSNNLLEAGYALISWKTMKSGVFVENYEKNVAELPALYTELDRLSDDNTNRRKRIDHIIELAKRIVHLTSAFQKPDDSAVLLLLNPHSYVSTLEQDYRQYLSEVAALSDEEVLLQRNSPSLEESFKKRLLVLIVSALTFNVALALMLAVFFSKGITNRIDVLIDNTDRLSSGQVLNQPVSGEDEIKQLDLVMHKVVEELRKAEQRKQEFFQMVSHDLRSPLTTLQSNLGMMAADEFKSEAARNRVSRAQRSISRMIKLISQLLDIEKIEAGMLKINAVPTDLDGIISGTVEGMGDLAQEKQLIIAYTPVKVNAKADDERVSQILINILSNAIKVSPQGGKITVRVDEEDRMWRINVIDNGPGVPLDSQEQIFDRFYQLPTKDVRKTQGTGLGLPICRALVKAHGGDIGVISKPGNGSTFWFTLPKA